MAVVEVSALVEPEARVEIEATGSGAGMTRTAHLDTFVRDRLPPLEAQPEFCSTCRSCDTPMS
jgi:hypothetical protein